MLPIELERFCKEEWAKLSNDRGAKCFATKGASTKYLIISIRAVNTHVHVISKSFIFNKSAKIPPKPHYFEAMVESRVLKFYFLVHILKKGSVAYQNVENVKRSEYFPDVLYI